MADLFATKCANFGPRLMHDFGLTAVQAAGVLGNLGHESGGFRFMQEIGHKRGRGGLGIAQWTGPRRRSFEQWCAHHGVATSSDTGNYSYLAFELKGAYAPSIAQLKRCSTLDAATRSFCNSYERPGVVAMVSRLGYARKALAAFSPGNPAAAAAPPPKAVKKPAVKKPVADKHAVAAKKPAAKKAARPVAHRASKR